MNNITNPFGITPKSFLEIKRILSLYKNIIDKVLVFGSRAMGNYKNGSDIDLVIKFNQKIEFVEFLEIRSKLTNSDIIPYKIDALNYDSINSVELKKHIDKEAKEFSLN